MSRKVVFAILAAVAIATYWNALRVPFLWDDDIAITTNQSIHEIATSLNPPIETPASGRPAVNLSFAWNYGLDGVDPFGYHVFNLIVLVLCALLLFGIVKRTLARQLKGASEASVNSIAFAPALLWMVHPLLSETVDYTTQRSESLMGLFFLLTLYSAIRARDRKRGAKWIALAVLACAVGMATKESMATAPIAVVLYDLIFEFDSPAQAWNVRKGLYLGLAATWLELGLIIWHWPRSTVGGTSVSPFTYALNQTQMIARYLWLTVWPQSLVVDYGLPRQLRLMDVLPQALLVLALLTATIVALVRRRVAGFLGAMFFLTLAPTSSLVPIVSEVGAERRMFLPLAACAVLAVFAAIRFERLAPRKVAIAMLTIVVAALATRTVYRNRDYESPLDLWRTVVERRPHGRARFAYANQLMEAGRHDEATAQLRLAVPDYPDARAGLGTELLLQGNIEEGISVMDAFVQAAPNLPNRIPARVLLAQAHRALAERELTAHHAAVAATEAKKSIAIEPNNADAHNLLGAALASQGQIVAAIPEFQAALRINPKHETALRNLAQAFAYGRSNTSNATGR
jgi:Flp pilus assembly protein TadD